MLQAVIHGMVCIVPHKGVHTRAGHDRLCIMEGITARSYLASDNGLHKESKHCKHGQPAAQMTQVSTHSTDMREYLLHDYYHRFSVWGPQGWVQC